ncbi:MAG: anti-sigma factor antagonist [Oscillospiraceae bacterium]|nr:anti-sigma factor antagonist [Oscillospiraceae bacterium]MDD6085551.1 anti-sigma factor antagonist [Oscillospiraceae bacterium]MDY3256784.1 anti-sigma factor antagonist [Ruminococcus callidus]
MTFFSLCIWYNTEKYDYERKTDMNAETILKDDRLIISLSGELDHHNALQLRKYTDSEIKKYFCDNLELDFKNVTFMDSSGIGFIIGRYKIMKCLGGKLTITNPKPHIKRIFDVAGASAFADIVYNEENERELY